jgi:DNA modification methylase
MGGLYRQQTEHIGVFKYGKGASLNNVQLGRHGRNRTTLWTYPGMNAFGRGRDKALALHPTVKPVGLLADIILDCTARGDIVLDPFAGSASTLIAAHRTGRVGAGLEIDPLYVDASLARLKAVTGLEPIRERDGATWSDLIADAEVTP